MDPGAVDYVFSRTSTIGRSLNTKSSTSSLRTLGREENPTTEELFADEVIDLTVDEVDSRGGGSLLKDGEQALEYLRLPGTAEVIRSLDFIQVENVTLGTYDIEFLQIYVVARNNATGRSIVRGVPFCRTRVLMASLPKRPDEVCKILHFNENHGENNRPVLLDVDTKSIIRRRRLVSTNALYPDYRPSYFKVSGTLVCRWQLKVYFEISGRRTKPTEEAMERIHWDEADIDSRIPEKKLRTRWRGSHSPGGSSGGYEDGDSDNTRRINQKYTLFDSFSGAGGVSRGAQSAGFKIKYALDNSPHVWHTYRANFPQTQLYKMSVQQFIQRERRPIRVDILHLSPPCQYFSPAHTHNCAHDDENIFALFGCNELIHKTRPRIISLEQTFGITHDRHQVYLRALLGDFTQFGYSVRWRVVRLCTWGSAQDRKRLVLLAAAPGERLPPFPRATHGPGIRPFTTIADALRDLRVGDDLHDLQYVKYYQPRRPAFDPNRLSMTITTGGAIDGYYPDGSRPYTLREFACLQGFPKRHKFKGTKTAIKRQIGNAFPPNTVKVLYKHIEEWLLKQDGMTRCEPDLDDVVMIDDEPDSSGHHSHGYDERQSTMMTEVMEVDEPEFHQRSHCADIVDLT